MADQIKVFQALAQVEWQDPSKMKVIHVLAQVEYEATPTGTFAYTGNIGVTVTPEGSYHPEWSIEGTLGIVITPVSVYFYNAPGTYTYLGEVEVLIAPASTTLQDRVYQGSIPVTVLPNSETLCPIKYYSGAIGVEILPASSYKLPIVGWDKYTGYGMVDISFLEGDPPLWGIDGDVALSIDPAAAEISPYDELNVVGDLQLEVMITGEPTTLIPEVTEVVGSVAVGMVVEGEPKIAYPGITAATGTAAAKVNASGVTAIVEPETYITAVPATVEAVVSVPGVIGEETPWVLELVGTLEVNVGLFRPEPVQVIYPTPLVYQQEASISLKMDASGLPEAVTLQVLEVTGSTAVQLSVSGAAAFLTPSILRLVGAVKVAVLVEGELGAEEAQEIYETYVLSGQVYEPSIFTGFNFNSYAVYQGRIYAAGLDGIYLLGGEDDNGTPIHSGMRLDSYNFGTDREKRLRVLRLGDCGEGVQVKVVVGEKEGYFEVDRGRVPVSRDLQGREFTIDIADFDRLSQLEIVSLVLMKR